MYQIHVRVLQKLVQHRFWQWNTENCSEYNSLNSLYNYSDVVHLSPAAYLLQETWNGLKKTLLCDILSVGYSPGTFSEKQIRTGHHNLFLTKLCWLIPTSFLLSACKLFLCSEELELTWQVYNLLSSSFSCLQKTFTLSWHLSGSSPVLPKLKKPLSLTSLSLIESVPQKCRRNTVDSDNLENLSNLTSLTSPSSLLGLLC